MQKGCLYEAEEAGFYCVGSAGAVGKDARGKMTIVLYEWETAWVSVCIQSLEPTTKRTRVLHKLPITVLVWACLCQASIIRPSPDGSHWGIPGRKHGVVVEGAWLVSASIVFCMLTEYSTKLRYGMLHSTEYSADLPVSRLATLTSLSKHKRDQLECE